MLMKERTKFGELLKDIRLFNRQTLKQVSSALVIITTYLNEI